MKFFLSYARKDEVVIDEVYKILGAKAAWLDKAAIDNGEIILEKIEQGIKVATDLCCSGANRLAIRTG